MKLTGALAEKFSKIRNAFKYADLNGDGSVSTADLLEFLTAFGQIC